MHGFNRAAVRGTVCCNGDGFFCGEQRGFAVEASRFHCSSSLLLGTLFLPPRAMTVLSLEEWLLLSPHVLLASHVYVPRWPRQL